MTYLVWKSRNVAHRQAGCQYCGGATYLRDDNGVPAHKVCAEQASATRMEAAVAAYQTSTIGDT